MPSAKDYQDRILADRYAQKDTESEVRVGDPVVVSIKRKFEKDGDEIDSRELGRVVKIHRDNPAPTYEVALIDASKDESKWEVIKDLERPKIEILLETCYEDIAKRVSDGIIEREPKNTEFRDAVYHAMVNKDFIPAGRILAGLGCEDRTLTFFNCYVFPPPHDSRGGITKHWGMLFNTFSLGGGVGWDNSSHRPRGSLVRKVNGRSSGAVSWAEQYSQITGAVEQGGSRRGAALMALWCWHPDIVEFVQAKSQRETLLVDGKKISISKELLSNANVSILISDKFMQAVEKDQDWDLVFPDTDYPSYNKSWDGDLDKWLADGKPVTVYKTVKAAWLWNLIVEHAWLSGEPGLLFIEHANKMSNSYYYNKLSCTNPCGEIFLPPFGVCNLGHINLSRFIKGTAENIPATGRTWQEAQDAFDVERFKEVVTTGVRFLDNITDLNVYHIDENKKVQTDERRTGLGILGYGELLVRLGLRYGSTEALRFTDWLFGKLAQYSYTASMELAKERGAFPKFDPEKFVKSGFMQRMADGFGNLVRDIQEHGIRNVTLNTIAPTGSVGTMLGTTTGIEPYFLVEWTARNRIGTADEEANVLTSLKAKFGDDLPEYFVTTKDITPEEHVRTQAAAQRWIDASISKTVNLPNSATRNDVAKAYELMYKMGCKGGTVYRDGSRDKQVLYGKEDTKEAIVKDKTQAPMVVVDEYKTNGTSILRPKIDSGIGVTMSKQTPVGRLHATLRMHHKTGKPYDIFLVSGKGDISADVQALGRLISVILRMPDGEVISQESRLEIIRDQLHRIPGRGQTGWGMEKVISLPDGIAQILNDYLSGNFPMANIPMGEDQVVEFLEQFDDKKKSTRKDMAAWIVNEDRGIFEEDEQSLDEEDVVGFDFDICSKCGSATLVNVPGKCPYCITCMHSEC